MKATRSVHIGMKKNIVLDAGIVIPRCAKALFVNVQGKTNEKLFLSRDAQPCVSTCFIHSVSFLSFSTASLATLIAKSTSSLYGALSFVSIDHNILPLFVSIHSAVKDTFPR